MNKYKNSTLFLIKFFGTYFSLFLTYAIYLNHTQEKENGFQCSPITKKVADYTVTLLKFFNYTVSSVQHDAEMSIKLLVNNEYVARVIEGCNSVSIVILFVAFIVAFSGSKIKTILFVIAGSILIYGINILRIAFLSIMLYKYPEHQTILHNLIFPAIIYGVTFLLWVVWVYKFSYYKNE